MLLGYLSPPLSRPLSTYPTLLPLSPPHLCAKAIHAGGTLGGEVSGRIGHVGGGCVAGRDRGWVHAVHPRANGCVLAARGGRSIAVGGRVAWTDSHACVVCVCVCVCVLGVGERGMYVMIKVSHI